MIHSLFFRFSQNTERKKLIVRKKKKTLMAMETKLIMMINSTVCVCVLLLPMMKGMVLKPPFLGLAGWSVSLWFEGGLSMAAAICSIDPLKRKVMK